MVRLCRRALSAAAGASIALLALAPAVSAGEFVLYLLAGQSNMDGYGSVDELPGPLAGPQEGVWIFHGNSAEDGVPVDGRGAWLPLRPGHGRGFSSDGEEHRDSDRFGLELSFAARLRARHPERRIALVKYSRGGTSIDVEAAGEAGCWDPDYTGGQGEGAGVNQYDHCLATLRRATAVRDIDGDGEDDVLVPAGILWMQGESDANGSPAVALRYAAHLERLMDLFRAALRVDDLPVAVGRISDSGEASDGSVWTFGDVIRAGQHAYCDEDPSAVLVTVTDHLDYSDPWHYDSKGYVLLGITFADAIASLEEGAGGEQDGQAGAAGDGADGDGR